MFADWLTAAGLGSLKPAISALVLPPVPFLGLALAGAGLARARPRASRWLVAVACAGAWLSCCSGAARWVEDSFIDEPAPLDAPHRAELKSRAELGDRLAIVVLGGGMDSGALEYGGADLNGASLMRLRYATWLARQTGIPVAASGGTGWGSADRSIAPEATRMAAVARDEFGVPLRWTETTSRDTHENAANTLALLQAAGVREVVLVTHGSHMPRALREFHAAALSASSPMAVTPATMGQAWPADTAFTRWARAARTAGAADRSPLSPGCDEAPIT
jgi:uncharacterized SAM-binding protein YcdF (DUF218 family)